MLWGATDAARFMCTDRQRCSVVILQHGHDPAMNFDMMEGAGRAGKKHTPKEYPAEFLWVFSKIFAYRNLTLSQNEERGTLVTDLCTACVDSGSEFLTWSLISLEWV